MFLLLSLWCCMSSLFLLTFLEHQTTTIKLRVTSLKMIMPFSQGILSSVLKYQHIYKIIFVMICEHSIRQGRTVSVSCRGYIDRRLHRQRISDRGYIDKRSNWQRLIDSDYLIWVSMSKYSLAILTILFKCLVSDYSLSWCLTILLVGECLTNLLVGGCLTNLLVGECLTNLLVGVWLFS